MKYPAELYVSSSRPYTGLSDLEYPFHDRTVQDAPKIVKNWNLIALEAHGVLVGTPFATYRAASQELTLEQLTQKYGKPSVVSQHAVQNELGAAFNAVLAKWDRPNLSVTFDGITHSIEFREFRIDLPEAVKMREEWAKQGNGRPL